MQFYNNVGIKFDYDVWIWINIFYNWGNISMRNKKGSLGSTIFFIALTLVLIYGLVQFGIFDNIVDMVKGWFVK